MGVLTGITSSIVFSINTVITRRGVYGGNVFEAVAYATLYGIPMFLATSYLFNEIRYLLNPNPLFIIIFLTAGILHFILGRYLYYKSIHLSGATVATPIVTLTQVFAVLFAIVFLHESIPLLKGIGIVCALSGVTYLAYINLKDVRYFKGILIGILSTMVFASSTNLVRYGMTLAPYPNVGLLLSYIASSPTLLSFYIHRKRLNNLNPMMRRYLSYSGLTVNLGQLFRYLALTFIGVTVLSPIYGLMPIEVLALSYLVNRKYEKLTFEIAVANIVVTLGVSLVIMSGYV